MNAGPGLPTSEDMSRQFPLFKCLIQKDFKKNLYGNFPVQIIRSGIILFLFCSLLALSMRNDTVSASWDSGNVMNNFVFVGIILFILPLHFLGSMSAETLQGTFRNISLYPVGINTITSSKLVFSVISVASLASISLIAIFSPFLIMGIITMKLVSYYILLTILLFLAYFLMVFAGSFYANKAAANSGVQNIAGYSFAAMCISLFLTFWPIRFIFTSLFKIFDPDEINVGEEQAITVAEWISYFSPFEMAFHFANVLTRGSDLQPGYFLTIPLWILIGVHGMRYGKLVYMDVFFRRV